MTAPALMEETAASGQTGQPDRPVRTSRPDRGRARVLHLIPTIICCLLIMVAAPAGAVWQDSVQVQSTAALGTLTAPADLGCIGNLAGGTLNWDPVPGATGYEVTGPAGLIGTILNGVLTLVNGVLSYALPAVSLGSYKVRAVLAGTSWQSPQSSTTISLDSGLHLTCT